MSDQDDRSHDRRAVFRLGLRRLMEPVVDYLQQRVEISLPVVREVLRPPGALPEKKFLDTCYRCGNCVDVCPARAIRPFSSDDINLTGTPWIDPDLAACVVCEELACMKACPSGALKRVEPTQIRMGLARVDMGLCVRSRGDSCQLCVEKCPVGSVALSVGAAGRIEVTAEGCVGCGSCQFYCPTLPKAIRVDPV